MESSWIIVETKQILLRQLITNIFFCEMNVLRPPRIARPCPRGTVDSVCPFSGTGKSGPKGNLLK